MKHPRIRPRITALAVLTAAAVLASACSDDGADAPSDTITYSSQHEVPCLVGTWIQHAYLMRQYTDALVDQDSQGKIVPWLATAWSQSDDGKTWSFTLKPNVKFTDGTALDAQAVKTNADDYWFNAKTGGNWVAHAYLDTVWDSLTVTGPLTFEIHLKERYSPLLEVLSHEYFGILSPKSLAAGETSYCQRPVGSGPYVVTDWIRGDHVTFTR
ncbi:MAG: ABC transporter substrate-binding protein, partial [Gordonia sp. (in: high G+C Gram-positive bacteria)]